MQEETGVQLRAEIRAKLRRAKDDAGGLIQAAKRWSREGQEISRDILSNLINGRYVSENDDRKRRTMELLAHLRIEDDQPFEGSPRPLGCEREDSRSHSYREVCDVPVLACSSRIPAGKRRHSDAGEKLRPARESQSPGSTPCDASSLPEPLAPSSIAASRTGEVVANYAAVTLFTRKTTPQWADYRELDFRGGLLRSLSCNIKTSSQYFRFGFKLRTNRGRLFGDGSIQSSSDANLIVHIGRDKLSRELFFTSYWNGVREGANQVLRPVSDIASARFELSVDDLSMLSIAVDGVAIGPRSIPPEFCESAVMLAWGDHDEFEVQVRGLIATIATAR